MQMGYALGNKEKFMQESFVNRENWNPNVLKAYNEFVSEVGYFSEVTGVYANEIPLRMVVDDLVNSDETFFAENYYRGMEPYANGMDFFVKKMDWYMSKIMKSEGNIGVGRVLVDGFYDISGRGKDFVRVFGGIQLDPLGMMRSYRSKIAPTGIVAYRMNSDGTYGRLHPELLSKVQTSVLRDIRKNETNTISPLRIKSSLIPVQSARFFSMAGLYTPIKRPVSVPSEEAVTTSARHFNEIAHRQRSEYDKSVDDIIAGSLSLAAGVLGIAKISARRAKDGVIHIKRNIQEKLRQRNTSASSINPDIKAMIQNALKGKFRRVEYA